MSLNVPDCSKGVTSFVRNVRIIPCIKSPNVRNKDNVRNEENVRIPPRMVSGSQIPASANLSFSNKGKRATNSRLQKPIFL